MTRELTARELIEGIPSVFDPQQAQGVDAVIQFDVTGDEVFVGYITIKDCTCTYTEGQAENPSLTIETPAEVWVKLLKGELNPQVAFFKRMFKAKGDFSLFMRMGQLFARPRGM